MDRKEFLGCCALYAFGSPSTIEAATPETDAAAQREKEFVTNWLTDLFDTIDTELDEKTKVKLMAGCGKGCFRRHQFKVDIAVRGKDNLDNLLEAYKKNFEVWRDGEQVHVRFGPVVKACYCPAARYHPAKPNDIHCECTRATHQAIFETALGRPFKVEILESLRRGGKTCHFLVHLA